MTLEQMRILSTRHELRTSPEGRKMIDAWCTDRQAHYLDNFIRHVFRAKRLDEGYDMDAVRQEFEKISRDHPDDAFVLPQDAKRLSIQAAATGMQSAVLDVPGFREDDELRSLAEKMCDLGKEMWSSMTNDIDQYREIFVPAYIKGYHLGIEQMGLMEDKKRSELINYVVNQAMNGEGPKSLYIFAELIKKEMKDTQAESIYEL